MEVMSAGFKLLEHPSDIGAFAWGDSREEALVEASKAFTSIMVYPAGIEKHERRELRVIGVDATSQVIAWLNELVFLFDAEGLVFADFVIDSWTEAQIVGHAAGERFDPKQHEL